MLGIGILGGDLGVLAWSYKWQRFGTRWDLGRPRRCLRRRVTCPDAGWGKTTRRRTSTNRRRSKGQRKTRKRKLKLVTRMIKAIHPQTPHPDTRTAQHKWRIRSPSPPRMNHQAIETSSPPTRLPRAMNRQQDKVPCSIDLEFAKNS